MAALRPAREESETTAQHEHATAAIGSGDERTAATDAGAVEATANGRWGVPRRALTPLAICLEAAVLGVLAIIAANRVEGGPSLVLLGFGWAGFAVSAGASLVFAARSGRLDGREVRAAPAVTADEDEAARRAQEIVTDRPQTGRELGRRSGPGSGPGRAE